MEKCIDKMYEIKDFFHVIFLKESLSFRNTY